MVVLMDLDRSPAATALASVPTKPVHDSKTVPDHAHDIMTLAIIYSLEKEPMLRSPLLTACHFLEHTGLESL